MLENFREEHGISRRIYLTGILAVFAAVFLVASFSGYTWYLNNVISDPLNEDAEFPKESFDILWNEMDVEQSEKLGERNLKDIEKPRFTKRLLIGGTGMLDFAIVGGKFFGAVQSQNGSISEVTGRSVNICRKAEERPDIYCDRSSRYANIYSTMYKGWMTLGLNMGSLEKFYRNETAVKHLNAYIKRAEFYDSYLDPEGFEIKPVESVYYSSNSGLYLIGDSNSSLRVNGEIVDTENKGYLSYANTTIPLGENNVSRGNYSVELKVHRRIPKVGYSPDRGLGIVSDKGKHQYYPRARILGEEIDRTVNVENSSTYYKVGEEPEKVVFIGENQNVSYFLPKDQSSNWYRGKATGMTEKEYNKFFIPELFDEEESP